MRIGVFSDTHGDVSAAKRFYQRLAPLDYVFHLGDYASDGEKLGKLFGCPVYAVCGNCDFRPSAPSELQVNLGDKRFLLLHGHQYYSRNALLYRGEEVSADMILYGHTHLPELSADGARLILNPGSLSRPKGTSSESCAIIRLEGNDLTVHFVNADNAICGW